MIRIYEVKTEHEASKLPYSTYRVAAKTFAEAVSKIQKREIDECPESGERISQVIIMASESR